MPKGDGRGPFPSPEEQRRFEEFLKKRREATRWLIEEIRKSERITAADLAIRINCRG